MFIWLCPPTKGPFSRAHKESSSSNSSPKLGGTRTALACVRPPCIRREQHDQRLRASHRGGVSGEQDAYGHLADAPSAMFVRHVRADYRVHHREERKGRARRPPTGVSNVLNARGLHGSCGLSILAPQVAGSLPNPLFIWRHTAQPISPSFSYLPFVGCEEEGTFCSLQQEHLPPAWKLATGYSDEEPF
jgi:hypothetical protein